MHAESFRFNIEMIIFIVFASVLFLLYRYVIIQTFHGIFILLLRMDFLIIGSKSAF